MKYEYRGWQLYDYYQWLLERINGHMEPYYNYSLLLNKLHNMRFYWSIPMDGNRANDGIILRQIYMDENGISKFQQDARLDDTPCSVLEMMIGLAVRCEVEIMGEPGEDTTYKWFWLMVENLDLMRCTDDNFSGDYVKQQVKIMLDRAYKRNGFGGLFPVKMTRTDQRNLEIWAQMCGYLSEHFV